MPAWRSWRVHRASACQHLAAVRRREGDDRGGAGVRDLPLNPAPFCLLDEVDAPLDEANVGRFTNMVSEMSEQVQFLFVTHNKATMEAAQQLSGVTMREPGVSRLVSVDLAEAARLAGAA